MFSGRYVKISGNNKWFDWADFEKAVLGYRGNDLHIVPIKNTKIQGGNIVKVSSIEENNSSGNIPATELSSIINWIIGTLRDVYNVTIDSKELYAAVEATFTNLKWAHETGFADFSSSSNGTNSSWEYRVAFAIPQSLPNFFNSIVITINLEADVITETAWWGLQRHTAARFSARVTGLILAVTKGFMAPRS
jgi:hypothetical protein